MSVRVSASDWQEGGISEAEAIDIVHKGFSRGVFGQNQRMILHFDVIIREDLWHIGLADNGRAVDQCAGLNKRTFDQQRMVRRYQ